VNFHNGERIEQLEDQNYQGKVTARYVFKDGEVVRQEQVESAEPPRPSEPFADVEREFQNVVGSRPADPETRALSIRSGLESGTEIK
jgi:hypothetical protein